MPGFRIGDGIPDVDWDDLSEEEQRDLEEFADVLYEGKKSRERNTKIYDLAVRQAEAEEELEVAMVKLSAAIADFTESRRRSMPAASRIILSAAAVYEAVGLLEDLEDKKEEVIYD